MARLSLTVMFLLTLIAGVAAQRPSTQAAPAPASQPPSPPSAAPASQGGGQQGFTYNPEGRRDPFVSLLRRGADPRNGVGGNRPSGLPGLSISEVTLKGTVASRGGFVAILQGVDNKTYIVRPGDKLFDGIVRSISQDAIVLFQQVNDPLSLDRQREVRKVLRQTEEAK